MALTRRPERGGAPLAALFLVSLGTVGFEIALTRFFAVSKWSEYGYWVISIVLAGFAFSGVAVALARPWFARHAAALLGWLPPVLVATAAGGYWIAAANPFNPLQLQNTATLWPQLGNIAGYYAALLPFFALAGLFISLCFLADSRRIGLVYGTDLGGAGAGGVFVLILMAFAHPFRLVPCLLLPLALPGFLGARGWPGAAVATALALLAAEAGLLGWDPARINDFKAIYAPLHVPDSRTLAEIDSPHGLYDLLDDFTERVDTDVSNNSAMLGIPGPPTTYGLYRDGNRIAALPKPGPIDSRYAPGTLAALPYALLTKPRVLLGGGSGGFRVAEALALGAASVDVAEPEPILRRAIARGLGPAPAPRLPADARVLTDPPIALALAAGRDRYDLVDLSGDFADSAEANASSLTAEAITAYLRALSPAGLVSIPVSIREFPAYATRMLATVRAGLLRDGVRDVAAHVLVYRSAWNVRVLVSPEPFSPARIAAARAWCDARSFDVSWYPGIDVVAARAGLYNDLPDVSFEDAQVTSGEGAHDAVADEARATLAGTRTASARTFDLSPVTLDRPSLNAVLRLDGLGTILRRLELLPQGEVAPLVNVAVLAQAVVIALLVLAVPLLFARRLGRGADLGRAAIYFPALGLGFLMIEIGAIETATFLLSDRVLAFSLVLTAMLVCSGLGSLLSGRVGASPGWSPRRALLVAVAVIVAWCGAMLVILPGASLAVLSWRLPARMALVVAVMAPVSVALGLPFPLGLGRLERAAGPDAPFGSQSGNQSGNQSGALPWAWALNGAFSVVATPLANLIVLEQGHARVFQAAFLLYLVAAASFPRATRTL